MKKATRSTGRFLNRVAFFWLFLINTKTVMFQKNLISNVCISIVLVLIISVYFNNNTSKSHIKTYFCGTNNENFEI